MLKVFRVFIVIIEILLALITTEIMKILHDLFLEVNFLQIQTLSKKIIVFSNIVQEDHFWLNCVVFFVLSICLNDGDLDMLARSV